MPRKCTFRVAHVSGQDDNHKAVELNHHSPTTQGWQSGRFCLYPQDIVIQLESRMRLRKLQILSHQYLIATKIEFYVGDVPDSTPASLQNARYTRLGYVALSDNEKTGFKARELKSVHVDANGMFVKLVIHKNHVNRHNMYNQVGIVALNVIGDDLNKEPDYRAEKLDPAVDPTISAFKPDYISPLDDLAFDMYQDAEVAQIIRKLDKKKQEAVLQERYDYAKKLKVAIQDLQKVGEKLGKFDVEKRQAVLNEDYDKAKLKKVQMDEFRLQVYRQLEIHDLLEVGGSRHPDPVSLEPARVTPPAILPELSSRPPPVVPVYTSGAITPPRTPYDERPLPAIKNKYRPDDRESKKLTPVPESDDKATVESSPRQEAENLSYPEPPPDRRASTSYEDRPLPVNKATGGGNDDDDDTGNVTGEPEPMSEKDQREAASAIEVFGLPTVAKAYSKTWSFREDALLELYKQLRERDSASTPRDDARSMMRAAIPLVSKGIRDKVNAVFTAALSLLRMILTEFAPNHKATKGDVSYAVEKTLPSLLQRTGDTAVRVRDAAKTFILDESRFPDVRPLHAVPAECVKPFKLSIAPRLALSRVEVVQELYAEHGINNSGLSVENLMNFCTTAIQHNSGEVREKAELLIIDLYKDHGAPVKDFLPPDDEKTRRNVLYKQLFEAFDRIDGKPSKDDIRKQKAEAEIKKEKEIQELQQQLAQLKDMAAGKQPIDENALKDDPKKDKKSSRPAPKKVGSKAEPSKSNAAEGDDPVFQIDQTCIFCGEKNESFTDDGLDLHYWKSCPMLKRCTFCKQVVEIAGFTEHLLTECDAKDNFQKCPRCTEAIPKAEFDQHLKEKTDNPAENGKSHCPLCHLNIPAGEDEWKTHLMGKDGCKQNPRRLQALSKNKNAGKGGKGGSKIPASKGAGGGGGSKSTPRK